MALQSFTNEQLNYFKFAFVVLDEFPKALRQTFKQMWDNSFGHLPGFQPWDDSLVVRNMFLATEGGKTKVPTNLSYDEWDCTTLFQATIFAQSFALPDSAGHHRTLRDLYVKPHKLPHGTFHASVVSPVGNNAETFALAIDQLRLLRNTLCHSSTSKISKPTFDQHIQLTKDAIKALGLTTDPIDAVGSLAETDFPIQRVRTLEDDIRKELQKENAFLKDDVKDELMSIQSDLEQLNQERQKDEKQAARERKEIQELQKQENTFLRKDMKDELLAIRSDITQLSKESKKDVERAAKEKNEEIQELQKEMRKDIRKLELQVENTFLKEDIKEETSLLIESKPFIPRSCLLLKVPHFTGREKECDEIIGHLTSESTRIVSVWGPPGFGKTSIAITVGHHLQAQGLPVYFLSLRELKSKSDLTSKFLSLFRQSTTFENEKFLARLSPDDELCSIFDEVADHCVFILDNADDLFESGVPNVKKDVINLIRDFLNRSDKVTFLLTTRESIGFLDLRFQGHHDVKIKELDELSSQNLVNELLPKANTIDCINVAHICGNVPLAMKLLCSSISEDFPQPRQCIDDFMESTDNILEMLDNPDYPSDQRLKSLFEASYQRLSPQEKESLVSLCILPDEFDGEIAAAVLRRSKPEVSKMLQRLWRKSLIDSSPNFETFSFHKLLQSFTREKGESEMKQTVLNSKIRFHEFYIDLFEELNNNFLTGHSMSAYIRYFEEEQHIVQSLIDGCLEFKTVDKVCDVLISAELFLYFLYWRDRAIFDKIYDSAITAAYKTEKNNFQQGLLICKAFGDVTLGTNGKTEQLLSEAKEFPTFNFRTSVLDFMFGSSIFDAEQKAKHSCFGGIYQLVVGKVKDGVKRLEEAVSLLGTSPEHTILKIIIFQILAVYFRSNNNKRSSSFYTKAEQECRTVGDMGLLVISKVEETTKKGNEDNIHSESAQNKKNQSLQLEVLFFVSQAVGNFSTTDIDQCFQNLLPRILQDSEIALQEGTTGSFNYHRTGSFLLNKLCKGQNLRHIKERIHFKRKAFQGSIKDESKLPSIPEKQQGGFRNKDSYLEALEWHQRTVSITLKLFPEEHPKMADSYRELGNAQLSLGDYASAAESHRRALAIRLKQFGEEHSETAKSYHSLGITQHSLGDYASAAESHKRALAIRLKLFGEEHSETAKSFHSLGITQHSLGDYTSAAESNKRALAIRLKQFGEENSDTAKSYHSLGVTQHSLGDFASAAESHKRALAIRLKQFGEKHSETAKSYHSLGITQHSLGDYTKAAESKKCTLAFTLKLFGEESSVTADSYHSLGVTQHSLGDYTSAAESQKRALAIRLKLFGEEHSETANSYHNSGVTQQSLGDYTSAAESHKRALAIRLKLFGEEHSETADSCHELGITQHSMEDYTAAAESKRRALAIRLKLFGEEHSEMAESYNSLGVTQHSLGDYTSAAESHKHALAIGLKLFGEEHSETAKSYHSLGITQHSLGAYTSAAESHKHALAIRLKLFGEEHSETAESYHSLGITQHSIGDYTAAAESHKHALAIRLKLFGEEHSETAESYHSLGITQHSLGDYTAAAESHKHALAIRLKVFEEEHSETAESYHSIGITQHSLGDYASAAESHKHALVIRLKLFGEEHSETAKSYHSIGIAQHSLADYTAAAQSKRLTLAIRLKLFGEEHSETADSCYSLGITQHSLGDYASAAESKKRALAIGLKLFGEEHSETADSYYTLGITQHSLGDYASAAESHKRALAIRLKLFGEEHSETAKSYHSLGITQHSLGDYTTAAESKKRALAIRLKVFGEEHSMTAKSYQSLGKTQHSLEDYTAAAESKSRALAIMKKLCKDSHRR